MDVEKIILEQIKETDSGGIYTNSQSHLILKLCHEIRRIRLERAEYEKVANEWMQDYDRLKEKYEPDILVESVDRSGDE